MEKNNKILYVVIIVFTLVLVIIADVFDIPSHFGISQEMLKLNPWVELVISAFVAIFAALIAAYATIRSVSMTIKKQEENRKDDNRKDALPMIQIDYLAKIKMANKKEVYIKQKIDGSLKKFEPIQSNGYIRIPIRNVGLREMYDVRVLFEDSDNFSKSEEEQPLVPILYKDDLAYMFIETITYMPKDIGKTELVNDVHPTTTIFFNVLFNDCFGNAYKQKFSIDISYDYLRIINKKSKGMYKDFQNAGWVGFETLSAPILVNEISC